MAKKVKNPSVLDRALGNVNKADPVFLGLRVPPKTKEQLEAQAKKNGVSLNEHLQGLLQEKAGGNPNSVAVASDLVRTGRRRAKRAVESSATAVADVRDRFDSLKQLWDDLVRDVKGTLSGGSFGFWDGKPDSETKQMLDSLETQMVACEKALAETRDTMLGLPAGTSKVPAGKRPERTSVLDRALGNE